MHRFVWDLAWGSSGGPTVEEDVELRNPHGPKVLPGTYEVRLMVDGKTCNGSLQIVMDPRSPATSEVLAEQEKLGRKIFEESMQARRALAEISSVRKQLGDIQVKVGPQKSQITSAMEDAQRALGTILKRDDNPATAGMGLKNAYLGLASALRVVEGGDRPVPAQAVSLYEESSQYATEGLKQWATFKARNLPTLNQQLQDAKLPPIAIAEIEEEVNFLMSR
jgi:hypothetical protein